MEPERGRRRRVCQSTRRWTASGWSWASWDANCVSRGSLGGMNRGWLISKNQEPRWIGLSHGIFVKYLIFWSWVSFRVRYVSHATWVEDDLVLTCPCLAASYLCSLVPLCVFLVDCILSSVLRSSRLQSRLCRRGSSNARLLGSGSSERNLRECCPEGQSEEELTLDLMLCSVSCSQSLICLPTN